MFWPCETRTSTCRNLATISSGLYRFLAITVLLDVKDIPQVGPLQWGWITRAGQCRLITETMNFTGKPAPIDECGAIHRFSDSFMTRANLRDEAPAYAGIPGRYW